jgi:thiamine-monophosphate kinase
MCSISEIGKIAQGGASPTTLIIHSGPRTLDELGERSILHNLIAPRLSTSKSGLHGIGDDCAELESPPAGHKLLVTTDPCPTPIVFEIADKDYWHYGRMTVLINVSDLAAMGARPNGIVVSTVMPSDMLVADYQRFLDGLVEAADEWACPVVGGNIKDGPGFTATGTAFGSAPATHIMRRTGARPGDIVCVAGRMGLFWAAVFRQLYPQWRRPLPTDQEHDLDQALRRPVARLREGQILAASGLVTCCMDASDGVAGCLNELAVRNGTDIVIHDDLLVPEPCVSAAAAQVGVDPRKLMLSWGNWELVFTVPQNRFDDLHDLAQANNLPIAAVGEMRQGPGSVLLTRNGELAPLVNLASERFSRTSYFTHGIGAYADWLMQSPLTELGDKR